MQRSGLGVCGEMKMEALGSSHFGPKFKNKLDALNTSKKPESFLLKTSFPRKQAERILSRPPPAVTCWDGANGSSEASSADQLNPAHDRTKQQTLKPVPLLSYLLHNLRYHVSQASLFLGDVFYTASKSKQWGGSLKIPIGMVKRMYANHQTVNYPCQEF